MSLYPVIKKVKSPSALLLFAFLLLGAATRSSAQSTETHNFITYDTTFNVGYGGLSYLLHISRPANADTDARPAFIAMNGAGESGTSDITNRYGPGYWLENGWDGSVQLGNGKHYPIIITVQANQYWPQTTELLMLLKHILSTYHIKKNAVHLCGLGMGALAWSALICHQSTPGGEDGMKLVTSLVCLQGQSNTVSSAVAGNTLTGYTSFGHWAKKYHGKFFGLEGTLDYRNVGAISVNMNDSVPGSAYFSYEKIGGGAHCGWNSMYDPSAINWSSTATLGPNNALGASPNAMGTYKASTNLFQWMMRQGDTSIVVTKASTNAAPVVSAGGNITTYLPFNNALMAGSATGGTIVSYYWTKISGPLQYTISNPSVSNPTISNLVIGSYVFRLTATNNFGLAASSDVSIGVVALNTALQSASPSPIPGKIESESYYSMSGIGTIVTNDAGGGLCVGAIDPGDWMNYNVNVATAGKYTVSFRMSTGNFTSSLQLRQSDGTVLGTFALPKTGTSLTWQTVTGTVTLPAGVQTLRLYANGTIGFSINWMQFTIQPAAIPGKIEGENYDAMSGVLTQSTTDAGGGMNVGGIDNGDWMKYNITAADAGTYAVSFRIATAAAGASFQLKNTSGAVLATVSLPNTGNYQTWQTVNTTVTLPAGFQTLQLYSTSTVNWNLNWMQFGAAQPTVQAIPGKIEAESYNSMAGIATQATTDAGGGLNVGWIDLNDWMGYNVNVATAGTYTVSFRVAAASAGASFQLRNAGGTVLATINPPNSGGFQTWETVTANVTLPAGVQTLVIYSTSSGIQWNFNWMQFEAAQSTQPTQAIPGKIEAESYNSMGGIATQATTDAGGGLNVGWIDLNDWMSYNVNVAAAGTYTASFRVATSTAGASFQLRNAGGTVLATINPPNSGGFQTWETVTATVTLPAGVQTLVIYSTSSGIQWNFNWMQFASGGTVKTASEMPLVRVQAATITPDAQEQDLSNTPASFNLYPNPARDHFTLDINNGYTGPMTVQVINLSGAVIKVYASQKDGSSIHMDVPCDNLASGMYLVRVQIGSQWTIIKKWIKL